MNNHNQDGSYELHSQGGSATPSLQQQDSFNEKKPKKRMINPVKVVTRGVSQGSQAVVGGVVGGVTQGASVVRGGISQVEKGVNMVGDNLVKVPGVKYGVSFFDDYRKFMDRGNVIDLAVAVVIGAAFTAIVTSLVTDIITPIIALASGKNLEENFIILRKNPNENRTSAQKAENITWNWGNFIQTVINFFIVSACVFVIVKVYQIGRQKTEVTEKECDYCLKKIGLNAVRCPECTTWLDWDACAKVANMEKIASAAAMSAMNASAATMGPAYVDFPAPDLQQTQASLARF
ncbi:hypothetical protein BGZ70_010131 [Mortierella alpina]|uniref:Large-conductance mechanosensitive channel n=1 Tax=Mortierella alpina TaxID=64518 RepID=A0A9P6LZL3_MORAP|nr:hypothetical protein BGZ70_010131 [Mortierella alpina]